MVCFLKKDLEQTERDLDHSAVCAKHLAVDPTPIGAGQERDGRRNVLRRAEALKRIHLRHPVDEFLRFSVEEQIRGGRPRRYGVYRNRLPAQLFGKDPRQCLDSCFRRGVNAIGFELESDNTRGEVDDPPILAEAFGCFPESVERAFQVDGDLPIEGTSTPPNSFSATSNIRETSSAWLTSVFAVIAFSPADVILLTSAEASASLPALFTTTEKPSFASRSATAAPMPRDAPVVIAALAIVRESSVFITTYSFHAEATMKHIENRRLESTVG